MTQHRLKRVTQSGRRAVEGSPTGQKELRQGMARMVRQGARVLVESGVR